MDMGRPVQLQQSYGHFNWSSLDIPDLHCQGLADFVKLKANPVGNPLPSFGWNNLPQGYEILTI